MKRSRMYWWTAMPLCVLLFAACGDDEEPEEIVVDVVEDNGGGDTTDEPDASTGDMAEETGTDPIAETAGEPDTVEATCEPGGDTFDLNGTFAVEAIIAANAVIDVEGRAYFLSTLEQDGTTVTETTQTCRMVLPSVPEIAEITFPEALETVIREDVHVSTGEFLSGTEDCALFEPETQVIVLGAELDNPADDPLPTEDDMSTAVDQDEDGNPGVTLNADVLLCTEGTEQLYVAMRTVVSMIGEVHDSQGFAGEVIADLEQEILGMSNECLSEAGAIEIVIRPGSSFRAIRVDGVGGAVDLDTSEDDIVDCAELEVAIDTLFADGE